MGMATTFINGSDPDYIVEKFCNAKFTEANNDKEFEPVEVYKASSKSLNDSFYMFKADFMSGWHMLYKDLEGNYWLRPHSMFVGFVDNEKRFKRLEEEELFNIISQK